MSGTDLSPVPFFIKNTWPETLDASLSNGAVSVPLRVHHRARNYRLSIGANGQPALTVPPNGRLADAKDFLNRHSAWLEARLKRAPDSPALVPGTRIPLRGRQHMLEATGTLRGRPLARESLPDPILAVPGAPEHFARRLIDWLKDEAAIDLEERVIVHARTLGVSFKSISLRNQSTRWGSCASSGRLNFNWRLILAPPHVLDYVAAHEVAHLLEMNHSPAFWANVERALPDMKKGRVWLKANGRLLMAIGAD